MERQAYGCRGAHEGDSSRGEVTLEQIYQEWLPSSVGP